MTKVKKKKSICQISQIHQFLILDPRGFLTEGKKREKEHDQKEKGTSLFPFPIT